MGDVGWVGRGMWLGDMVGLGGESRGGGGKGGGDGGEEGGRGTR